MLSGKGDEQGTSRHVLHGSSPALYHRRRPVGNVVGLTINTMIVIKNLLLKKTTNAGQKIPHEILTKDLVLDKEVQAPHNHHIRAIGCVAYFTRRTFSKQAGQRRCQCVPSDVILRVQISPPLQF